MRTRALGFIATILLGLIATISPWLYYYHYLNFIVIISLDFTTTIFFGFSAIISLDLIAIIS